MAGVVLLAFSAGFPLHSLEFFLVLWRKNGVREGGSE